MHEVVTEASVVTCRVIKGVVGRGFEKIVDSNTKGNVKVIRTQQ